MNPLFVAKEICPSKVTSLKPSVIHMGCRITAFVFEQNYG